MGIYCSTTLNKIPRTFDFAQILYISGLHKNIGVIFAEKTTALVFVRELRMFPIYCTVLYLIKVQLNLRN